MKAQARGFDTLAVHSARSDNDSMSAFEKLAAYRQHRMKVAEGPECREYDVHWTYSLRTRLLCHRCRDRFSAAPHFDFECRRGSAGGDDDRPGSWRSAYTSKPPTPMMQGTIGIPSRMAVNQLSAAASLTRRPNKTRRTASIMPRPIASLRLRFDISILHSSGAVQRAILSSFMFDEVSTTSDPSECGRAESRQGSRARKTRIADQSPERQPGASWESGGESEHRPMLESSAGLIDTISTARPMDITEGTAPSPAGFSAATRVRACRTTPLLRVPVLRLWLQ